MNTVAVVDYGMGNLRSVCKALEHVAPRARIVLAQTGAAVASADRVVFPGQGAIGGCLAALDRHGLRDALLTAARAKPFLGLCLGLQVLYEFTEEGGGMKGLGIFRGRVPLFPAAQMIDASGARLKVPHMGWNRVRQMNGHPLWTGISQDTRFYFVHSYYADSADASHVAATTEYGIQFTSAAAQENIFAVQFHPEKSQEAGLRLLQNFVGWDGSRRWHNN